MVSPLCVWVVSFAKSESGREYFSEVLHLQTVSSIHWQLKTQRYSMQRHLLVIGEITWWFLLLLLLSPFSRVRLCATAEMAAHQASPSWDSPGKNTGVGCHFLLQCMKVKRESEVVQSCPTLSDPMDYGLPGSSMHGFSRQAYWSGVPWFLLNS